MNNMMRSVFLAVPFVAAGVSVPMTVAAEPTNLTFLHINDVYEFAPVRGQGGFAQLMTLLREERAEADNSLTTVGGDYLSPSLLSGLDQGANMIAMFNAVGVDYVSLGNHEFDFGPDVAMQRMADSNFPWIATNVLDADGS
ncbi:MAG: metallophosphoesterase, partial [Alphaproteobacteria bacterium]